MKNCLAVFPLQWSGLDYFAGVIRLFAELKGNDFRLHHCEPEDFSPDHVRGGRFDGYIVSVPGDGRAMKALAASEKPTVLVNISDRALSARTRSITSVWVDNFNIGRIGAEHLRERGEFKSYAFVYFRQHPDWEFYARERETAFRSELRKSGIHAHSFPPDGDFSDKALARWLDGLPKPAALLAENDKTSIRILACCKKLRLSVPGDIALLGVDDVPALTTGEERSLSSIRPDFGAIGYRAAEELVRLLRGRTTRRHREIVIPVTEISIRDSTRGALSAARLVADARRFIETNAERPLSPREIAAQLGKSRRLVDLRFRQTLGKTLSEVIEDVRMARVVSELEDPGATVVQIARKLNFKSPNQLTRVFKRHFGKSIRTHLGSAHSP